MTQVEQALAFASQYMMDKDLKTETQKALKWCLEKNLITQAQLSKAQQNRQNLQSLSSQALAMYLRRKHLDSLK